jgi:hypothetical protein
LATVFLFTQIFYRPSLTHVVEAREDAEVEKEDEGEPESLSKQLLRQLLRIRRGEPVERLVLRL